VLRQVEPSVVTILVGDGLGSGVVYRRDGVIITNEHVVRPASDKMVEVAFADGRRIPGQVQASDPVSDIAVVKVARTGLPTVKFRMELPQQGELAIALGSPLGFENSATAGIISGLNRSIPAIDQQGQPLVDLIQTDAAISPGNSGGALLDGQGRVVGISEAYIAPQAGAVSLGFAIPAATAVNAADQLLRTGKVRHAFLGLQVATLTPQIADRLGLDVTSGVLVRAVVVNGPADQAGINPGDVIRTFDGKPVGSTEDFLAQLRDASPGQQVTLGIRREGHDQDIEVTAADRPS
jgi:S1-C subfamily serine protease